MAGILKPGQTFTCSFEDVNRLAPSRTSRVARLSANTRKKQGHVYVRRFRLQQPFTSISSQTLGLWGATKERDLCAAALSEIGICLRDKPFRGCPSSRVQALRDEHQRPLGFFCDLRDSPFSISDRIQRLQKALWPSFRKVIDPFESAQEVRLIRWAQIGLE
jgi:hypothetical protein